MLPDLADAAEICQPNWGFKNESPGFSTVKFPRLSLFEHVQAAGAGLN